MYGELFISDPVDYGSGDFMPVYKKKTHIVCLRERVHVFDERLLVLLLRQCMHARECYERSGTRTNSTTPLHSSTKSWKPRWIALARSTTVSNTN